MKAAGILFVSLNGNALFLRRTMTAPDCPGCWDFPGGGSEGDETAEDTALREAREEIGFVPEGERVLHTRTRPGSTLKGVADHGASPLPLPIAGGAPAVPAPAAVPMPGDVDFTTFLQRVTNEFTPELNDEHDGWAWAPIDAPPEPLHPGCRIALERIALDELGVARAIAEGRLTSPQRYENMWLFAIRITGTEAAFRPQHGEFVYRKPENYLNPEMLARCNGLPVLLTHPPSALLNSEEFSARVVGTVFLPYIAGDEIWAVAKIFVDDVAQMMSEGNLSTSPGVNFEDFSVNATLTLEDGHKVLIEGKPSLFDHVAICKLGVWDKGGDPSGIRSESREDSAMSAEEEKAKKDAEEKAKKDAAEAQAKKDADEAEAKAKKDAEEAEAKKKADADAGTQLDKDLKHMLDSIGSKMDGIGKRLDAIEAGDKAKKDAEEKERREKGDPEQLAADKAKKDAEEAAEKEKADKAKKDAEEKAKADTAAVRASIEELKGMIPKNVLDRDYHAMLDTQSRFDEVFVEFGERAPVPQLNETVRLYEQRCLRTLQKHSPSWAKADLTKAFADDATFDIARKQITDEALVTARNPANIPSGQLRMVEKRRDGHIVREFYGQPRDWMDALAGPVKLKAEGAFKTGSLGQR